MYFSFPKQQLINYFLKLHTSCIICGKLGEGPLCKACINKFIFTPPQCIFCEKFWPQGFHNKCLPKAFTSHEIEHSTNKTTPPMTFFENIHFYTYNNSARKLIASIKKYANKMDFYALKLLFENYFKIDPFNQLKYLQQFIKTLILQEIAIKIIITPIPNSPTSINKRGFNFCEILAKIFLELLQNYLKMPEITVQIANIFRNIGKTSQKEQKSRLSRVSHAYSSIYLLNAKCLEILKYASKNATKPTESIFIILDDIATTNTTMLSAAEQLIKCVKLFKNLESLPISASINTLPNPQHIHHSNRLSRIQFNQKNKNFIHVLTLTIFKKEKDRQKYTTYRL